MWNKIVVVVSAVNNSCSFKLENNPGYRNCYSLFKLSFSAFLWHNWMKSVVVLLYAFLSATSLRTIAHNFSHIKK